MLACEVGSIEIVHLFLDAGVSLDLQDNVFYHSFLIYLII